MSSQFYLPLVIRIPEYRRKLKSSAVVLLANEGKAEYPAHQEEKVISVLGPNMVNEHPEENALFAVGMTELLGHLLNFR